MANLKTHSTPLQAMTTQHLRTVKHARSITLNQPNKFNNESLPKAIRLSREEYQDLMSEMQQAATLIRLSFSH